MVDPTGTSPERALQSVHYTDGFERVNGSRRVPTLPYVILAGLLLIGAFFAGVLAVMAPADESTIQTIDALMAVAFSVGAALLWVLGPRSRNGAALDLTLALIAIVVLFSVPRLDNPAGQLAVGLGLVQFAVFAAYFRPWNRFLIELTLLLGTYGLAVLLNPNPMPLVHFVLVTAVMVVTSLMVAVLGRELHKQALHDSMTGLLNRRGLELMAENARAISDRSGAPVTVGLIDLDHLKALNDKDGHVAGDHRIVDIADSWQNQLRRSDVIARFGGDEFAVVLPGTTVQGTEELVARARQGHEGQWSIGFADWAPDEDLYEALTRADHELYKAKAKRRLID